jgi:DNA polymerase III subunit delta'
MTFSSLIGNDSAKDFLEIAASKDTPQVFLFTGPEGVGKNAFAHGFAKKLLGEKHAVKLEKAIHPDLLLFRPEGKTYMHSIASIRKILEEASFPPFEADLKVYIIEDVERMLPSSSNALLKTLEEPHSHLRFILLSAHPEEVLPTIASRCCRVPFYPIEESLLSKYLVENKEISIEKASQITLQSQGSLKKALSLLEELKDPVREGFISLLKDHFLYPLSLDFMQNLAKLEKILDKKSDSDKESGSFMPLMDNLLSDLLFWLRDLHCLQTIDNPELYFSSNKEDLQKQLSFNKKLPSLEKAFNHVEKARLALQRSTKPKVVLEDLFFQLSAK